MFFCMHSHNGETEEVVSECGGGKVIVRLVIHIFKDVLTDNDPGGRLEGESKNTETRHTPDISVQPTRVRLE